MQEDVTVKDGCLTVPKGLKLGANRRLTGEDVRAGAVILPAGTVLEAQHIALAAALGLTEIVVRRRLTVAIFSTGDEVVEPGAVRGSAAIFDSNRFLLAELLDRLGVVITDLGIVPDNADTLAGALEKAAGHDLIITSGGVSAGEADHVRKAVERVGKLVFWRVAIKPGRPVAMGVIRGTKGRKRGLRRSAGESSSRFCYLRACRETTVASAFRRAAGPVGTVAGARGLRLQKKERPPRICACDIEARQRRRSRGGQTSAGWRGHTHIADRNRRAVGDS